MCARRRPTRRRGCTPTRFIPRSRPGSFLTDVAEEDGPFIYVPGSHRPTRRRLSWERRASMTAARSPDFQSARGSLRITPETVRRLGFGEPKAFAVPQNTLVVADTVGFHARGLSARPSVRRRNMGLRAPQPVPALARLRPGRDAVGQGARGAPLLVGHGHCRKAAPGRQPMAKRRNRDPDRISPHDRAYRESRACPVDTQEYQIW